MQNENGFKTIAQIHMSEWIHLTLTHVQKQMFNTNLRNWKKNDFFSPNFSSHNCILDFIFYFCYIDQENDNGMIWSWSSLIYNRVFPFYFEVLNFTRIFSSPKHFVMVSRIWGAKWYFFLVSDLWFTFKNSIYHSLTYDYLCDVIFFSHFTS